MNEDISLRSQVLPRDEDDRQTPRRLQWCHGLESNVDSGQNREASLLDTYLYITLYDITHLGHDYLTSAELEAVHASAEKTNVLTLSRVDLSNYLAPQRPSHPQASYEERHQSACLLSWTHVPLARLHPRLRDTRDINGMIADLLRCCSGAVS